jgi:hypothetical protein
MSLILAHYLPQGLEVIFQDANGRILCGKIMDRKSFDSLANNIAVHSLSSSKSSQGVFVGTDEAGSWWNIESVTVLKVSPTDKDKFLYQLKGAV